MIAPINIPGARSIMRSPIIIRFCIWVMSLVSLVTSDPVLKRSRLAKENFCTFRNRSFRRSAPKFMAAFEAKYAPPIPPSIIKKENTAITAPTPTMYPIFLSGAPTFMIFAIRAGRTTSPTTSRIIKSGPAIK